jgi:hypothetical protein
MAQKLILAEQMTKLKANGSKSATGADGSAFEPVVKFFMPGGGATWLITEIADDGDTLFGLCDLGHGSPELGYVSLDELRTVRGRFGLKVERDAHFKAKKTLAEYTDDARSLGMIRV